MQFPKKAHKMQEMSVEDYRKMVETNPLMIPKRSMLEPRKSKTMRAICPEASLQKAANELIELRKWDYIRFDDWFLSWMHAAATPQAKKHFFGQVGGKLPDNFIMVPIADGMFLGVKMELKTEDAKGRAVGQLHGKQKTYARNEKWFIARNTRQIEEVLNIIDKTVEKIKNLFANKAQ